MLIFLDLLLFFVDLFLQIFSLTYVATPEGEEDATEADLDAENAATTTRKVRSPIIPSEILQPSHLSSINLSADEQRKYAEAIAAISRGEEPAHFRGAMAKESLGIEGFNVLHCGISDAMRIYYVLHGGKAYILDASNHDMRSLAVAVQSFKASL